MAEVKELWSKKVAGAVDALAISPDGGLVLAGASDGILHLFDREGKALWSQPTDSQIAALDMSSTGDQIAVGLKSGAVLFIDRGGHIIWRHDAGEPVLSAAISHNGKHILLGTAGGSILFLNHLGKPLWTRKARDAVTAVALSSSANYAAAGSDDTSIYFLDNYTTNMSGKVAWSIPAKGKVQDVAISADGFYTAAASSDAMVHFMDKLGKLYWSHRVENTVASLEMSSSGDYIIIGAAGGAHPGQVCLFHRNEGLMWRYITGQATVGSVDISSTGAFMVAGSQQEEVYLFHRNQKLVWKRKVDGFADAVAISSDGRFTAAGTMKGALSLFDNTPVVEELKARTQDEAELEIGLFRPMRTSAPAFEEEPETPTASQASSPAAASTQQARTGALEAVVDACLLVVLGLIGGVVYFMYNGGIMLEQGLFILVLLLVVMGCLAYLFYTYVIRKPKKKQPSFY
jgi:WD40 repeat protein